jgi:DNA-binding MarR family transcriptional regulator
MHRTNCKPRAGSRAALIEALTAAGRGHSTATVLFHETMAGRFGLSATDTKAIDILSRGGPLTAGDLVERTGLASPSVTALIDRLEQKGFVRRVRDTMDRRKVIIELVPEGLARMGSAFAEFQDSLDELWAPYNMEELKIILDFLQRAEAHMRVQAERAAAAGRIGTSASVA